MEKKVQRGAEEAVAEVCFEAGRLQNFEENWRNLTSGENIQDIAFHCHIEFEQGVLRQEKIPLKNSAYISFRRLYCRSKIKHLSCYSAIGTT